jgi:hypothetical protein
MMKKTTKLMPLWRHKRSQNTGVVVTLVDEVMIAVDALMRISSRTEGEFARLRMTAARRSWRCRLSTQGELSAPSKHFGCALFSLLSMQEIRL